MASFYLYIIKKDYFVNPSSVVSNRGDRVIRFFLFLAFQWYICTLLLFFYSIKQQMAKWLVYWFDFIFLSKTFLKIYVHIYKYIVHDKKGHFILSFWYLPACNWPILKQKYSQLWTFCDIISRFQIFRQY